MKKFLFFLYTLLFSCTVIAQITYKEIKSKKLNTTRQLKIKLPKNYDPESNLKHPVIVVFDGDYLFEPVAGQVAFQTYFDEIPKSIIVGVVQSKDRYHDTFCDEVSGLPLETGARFYEFIAQELIPYLDNNYNTSKFRVAIGHNTMGNFINSFLFKSEPLFQAYINLSPDFKGNLNTNLVSRLEWLKNDVFYYLATCDKDIKYINEIVHETNAQLNNVNNKSLTYYFDEFEGDNHYTMVTGALSNALDKVFEIYKPLDEKELNEKVLTYEGTLDVYMVKRQQRIEDLFGIFKPITEEEFEKVVNIAEQREDLESLQKIGKLASKLDPESSLGTYYLALYAEKVGKTKKAVKLYELALELDMKSFIDRELILSRMESLKYVAEDYQEED